MTLSPNARRERRVTWRSVLDRGAVAAAFLMILWFLTAGLFPGSERPFETAAVGGPKPATNTAAPVAAKVP